MALLKVYDDIQNSNDAVGFFGDHMDVFSADKVSDFVNTTTDEEIDGRIHCRGGSVIEGYTIHDILTHSNKKITMTVEGLCASIATVVLLSAKPENRKIYPNGELIIHEPYIPPYTLADSYTAHDLAEMAMQLERETDRLLDFYVMHTGADRAELAEMVKKETSLNAEEAKRLGFVSEILPPMMNRSNQWKQLINQNKMEHKEWNEKLEKQETILNKILRKLGLSAVNMTLTDTTGATLTIERESGDPAVGDMASPDGTYTMEDGKVITVTDGAITEIKEPETPANEELEQAKARIAELENELTTLKDTQAQAIETAVTAKVEEATAEAKALLIELKGLKSTYKPEARAGKDQETNISPLKARVEAAKKKLNKK